MSDESHIPQLQQEDFSAYQDKLRAWARSLDTTPDQLVEVLRAGGEGAQHVRELLGIRAA
ncbi:MAG: hypothetical protein JWQ13_2756 [Ramlibacter sp.]|jgi:hypothetical protein|nr:hypothetical protein [Ramlibacter sp.]